MHLFGRLYSPATQFFVLSYFLWGVKLYPYKIKGWGQTGFNHADGGGPGGGDVAQTFLR